MSDSKVAFRKTSRHQKLRETLNWPRTHFWTPHPVRLGRTKVKYFEAEDGNLAVGDGRSEAFEVDDGALVGGDHALVGT